MSAKCCTFMVLKIRRKTASHVQRYSKKSDRARKKSFFLDSQLSDKKIKNI